MRPILCLLIFVTACTSTPDAGGSGGTGGAGGIGGSPFLPNCDDHVIDPDGPPKNPFLADSIYAVPHGDSQEEKIISF